MKKVNKFSLLLCVLTICSFLLIGNVSCKEYPIVSSCNVKNPVKDLPWLKELIKTAKKNHDHIEVYICTYADGEKGYLIDACVDCPDAGYSFRDCEGNVICGGGGITGVNTCNELGINFENKILICKD